MANPVLVNIPEWKWVNIAEQVKYLKIYRQNTTVYYYKTYRQTTEDPPADPVIGTIPDDAIKIFQESYLECIESSESLDVYIMCANQDDDADETGSVIVGEVDDFRDVADQDQHTPTVIVKFNQVHDSTTLASEALINQREIVVTSSTGIVVGSYVILFSLVTQRFYFGEATDITGTPTIILDTPLDSTFPAGTFVDIAITDLSVNGLTTPQTFGLRGLGAPPGVDIQVDIERILFTCVADSAVSASLFADLPALLNGLVLRVRNGTTHNTFNIKSNRELAGLMFDFDVSAATNPQQGEDGFKTRFTISRLGVVIRLAVGEDLELIVQDNLLGITILECIAEGSIVLP